jgi:nicotinamide riboside kinase
MQELKKIVIIGPESTGKSTLCRLLAEHYQTVWCPEYARAYLLEQGTNYTFNDLLTIAKGQLALEEEYVQKMKGKLLLDDSRGRIDLGGGTRDDRRWTIDDIHSEKKERLKYPLLFLDTDMYVMKVWCEYVFNQCHFFILEKILEQRFDMYLLCNIDLPWVKDELREYPDLKSRAELYHMYKDILINQMVPWVDISGNYEERFSAAIKAVDALLTSS